MIKEIIANSDEIFLLNAGCKLRRDGYEELCAYWSCWLYC